MSKHRKGWKVASPPRKGEELRQYLRRLVDEDPLTIRDAEEMRRKWARARLDHDTSDEELGMTHEKVKP